MVIGREEVILTDNNSMAASGYHHTSAIQNQQIPSSHTHSAYIQKTGHSQVLQGPASLSTPQEFGALPSQSVGSYRQDCYNSASHPQLQRMQSVYVLPQGVNQQPHCPVQQNQNHGQQHGLGQQTLRLQQHNHLQGQPQSHAQLQAVSQLPQHNQPGPQQAAMQHPLGQSHLHQTMANQHFLVNHMNSAHSQQLHGSQSSLGQASQQLDGNPAQLAQTMGQQRGVSQQSLSQQQAANHQPSLPLRSVQANHVDYNILSRPLTLEDLISEVPSSSAQSFPLSGNNIQFLSGKNAFVINKTPQTVLVHHVPQISLQTQQSVQNHQYNLQNQMTLANQQTFQGQTFSNPHSLSVLTHNSQLPFQSQQPIHSQQSMPCGLSLSNHQSLQTQQNLQHQANFQNHHSVQSQAIQHMEVGSQQQSYSSGGGYTGQLHGQITGIDQQQQATCAQQQPTSVKQDQQRMLLVVGPNSAVSGGQYVTSHPSSQHVTLQQLPQNVNQTMGSPLAHTLPNSPQLNPQTPSQGAVNNSPQLNVQNSPQLSLQSSPQLALQGSPQQLSLQSSPSTHQNSAQIVMMSSAQSKQQLSLQDVSQVGNLPQLNSTSQAQTSQQMVQVQNANQVPHVQNSPHAVQLSGNVLPQQSFQVSPQVEVNQQGRNQLLGQNSGSSGRGRGQSKTNRGGRGRGRGRGGANSATGLHMAPDHFRPDLAFPVAVESSASNMEPAVSHADNSMRSQEPGMQELSMTVPKSEPSGTPLLQSNHLPCLNRYSPPSITYATNEVWPTPLPSIKREQCGSPPALIVNSAPPQSSQQSNISPALSPSSYLEDIKVSLPAPPPPPPAPVVTTAAAVSSPPQAQPAKPVVSESAEEKPKPRPNLPKRKLAEDEEEIAVCKYCGYCSSNFETCEGCKRMLPTDVKLVVKKKKLEHSEPGDERERSCGGGKVNSTPTIAGPSGNKRTMYGNKQQTSGTAFMNTTFSLPNNLTGQSAARGGSTRRRGSGTGRGGYRGRKPKEPVTVTISSDEDEEPSADTNQRMLVPTVTPNATSQEEEDGFFSVSVPKPNSFGTSRRNRMQDASGLCVRQQRTGEGLFFDIRGVRIGTMRTSGIDVRLRAQSIAFKVISELTGQELEFFISVIDMTWIKFCLSAAQPVIFLKVTPDCGQRLRVLLKMSPDSKETFEPSSQDNKKNMVVLIIDVVTSEPGLRQMLKLYSQMQSLTDFLQEIDYDTSNDLLVKSTPPVIQSVEQGIRNYSKIKPSPQLLVAMPLNDKGDHVAGGEGQNAENSPASMNGDMSSDANENVNSQDGRGSRTPSPKTGFVGPVEKLLMYPPHPTKGAITITNEDLFCLNESEFLNDVILDFYLKYLFFEKLSAADQARTYIFSSFFFKRLTQRNSSVGLEGQEKLTPAQRRHSRVKTWTRHVDIFEKDFLIIPINEKSHWILAVVCFPGLVAQEQYNYQAVPMGEEVVDQAGDAPSTSRKPKTQGSADDEEESQDSLPDPATTSTNSKGPLGKIISPEAAKKDKSMVSVGLRQACILIMDSLSGPSRNGIIRTLKDYLQVEWDLKKSTERDMSKTVRGCCPKVPQQNNYSDCGVFVLQYAESFFENPIANFSIPIKLGSWFPLSKVEKKREEIRSLILRLQAESSR